MRRAVALTFIVVLGLIVGCSSSKGSNVAKTDAPVLDVAPPAPSTNIPPAEPLFAAAPINDTPAVQFAAAPAPVAEKAAFTPAASTGSKKYTVKKGDTLFGIAKTQLGSGKDWQKIAAANPGLTPANLKAGQKIAMP